MAERPVSLEGPNRGFVIALCFLWLALGLLLVGPGRTSLGDARDDVREKQGRRDEWRSEFGQARDLSDDARIAWAAAYDRVAALGPTSATEPGLTAWVAEALRAPSVRHLEVIRESDENAVAQETLYLGSPTGTARVALEPVLIRVRFQARYEDISNILARIESSESAMDLRRIEMQRSVPEVRVDLELALWTRVEADS